MLRKIAACLSLFLCLAGSVPIAEAATSPAKVSSSAIPIYGYVVKHRYPHDPNAFTEGLFFKDGALYESTGLNHHSSLRKVELKTGKVLQSVDLPEQYFGEGIAPVGDNIVGVTWTSGTGFFFDLRNFQIKKTFHYSGEGWGLTSDAHQVYMSDGSAVIRLLNPATMQETGRLNVTANGKPVTRLNELEYVDGALLANVWGTDVIAKIDSTNGQVIAWIDLSHLLEPEQLGTTSADAVLNGIAYDAGHRRLFVTGKFWPTLFEIELRPLQ